MRLALFFGYSIIIVAIVIGIWVVINFPPAHGQSNETVTVVQPTPTLAQTPTAPNPNFQYLPQKAYVIPFAPEAGVPNTPIPLQAITTAPVVQQPGVSTVAPANGGFDIASILSMVVAAGSGLFAKIGYDKSKKVQETTQENSTAIVDSKTVQQELARLLFEWNKEKADALNDSPATKLESLKEETEKAVDTAAKA